MRVFVLMDSNMCSLSFYASPRRLFIIPTLMSLFVSVCIFTGCILKINSQESFSDGVNNFFLARVTSSCEHKYAFKNKLNDFQEKSSRDSFSCKLIQKEQFDVYERRDGMHLVASSAWLCIRSSWLSSAAVPSLCSSFIRINQSSSISNFLRRNLRCWKIWQRFPANFRIHGQVQAWKTTTNFVFVYC